MEKEISAVIGALVGALVTGFVSYYIFNRKAWGEHISTSRMEWIKEFRNDISLIMVLKGLDCLGNDFRRDVLVSINRVISKLNTSTDENLLINKELERELKKILIEKKDSKCEKDFCISSEYCDFEKIMKLSKTILESEWKKVKLEAKGKVRK